MFKFELGDVVKERFTGFTGVVMARSEYWTECRHYGILPKKLTKEGKIAEWDWLDEKRLIRVGKKSIRKRKGGRKKPPSGPEQNPPSM